MLRDRLATLTSAGYARRVGEHHVLTAKGRVVATVFRSVKRLWRLGPGVYAYEAVDGDGEVVIKDGRAELG